jgi:hypothetical protein
MRPWRIATLAAALALVLLTAGGAALASPEGEMDHEGEHVKQRGLAHYMPGEDGPGSGESTNATVVGNADPGGGFHADVVAHRGHAYLGSWGAGSARCPSFGVRVFDLKDPSDPEHVSTFADGVSEPAANGSWTEKVIVQSFAGPRFRGDVAVVTFQRCRAPGFRGFGLYDVTDPANPKRLALVPTVANGSHEIWLERRGNKLYVYTAVIDAEWVTRPNNSTPGPEKDFQIWDVSDPTAPVRVGQWGAWEELGIPGRFTESGVARSSFVHSVIGAVVGNQHRAYLSYWDSGTIILDVKDVTRPRFLGRTTFGLHEDGNAHSAWLARGGNVLIQADEDFNPFPTAIREQAWGYPRFYDISNPANPVPLSTFELETTRQTVTDRPGDFTVHDPKVRGNTVYFSWYAEGVVVVDISNPASPRQVAQFLPPPAEDPWGVFVPAQVNVWGVDLYNQYVLASDMSSGLWVFRVG